ncbi:probable pectinesterase 29 [Prunus avium]|uniref:Pectinesterase n=1 Tax=Prunus avium TaxID=42229 RepID=A0A6P5RKR8_PRUAV|nr:probable pectinesterase 29 [Prunus avium]
MSSCLRLDAHYYCSCVALILLGLGLLGQANAQMYRVDSNNKKLAYYTITVDQSGHGNFTSIQSAIDAVPINNRNWVSIKIKAGTYKEKVIIPVDKPYIILKGENRHKTLIVWDDHDSVAQSPTFASYADSIIVKSISFVNSYNNPVNNKNPRVPAVAAMIYGDKSSFYRCGFFGLQDTLWDGQGRHYYHLCTIQGAVDFIFGSAQSIFQKCSIQVLGGALDPGSAGYITAQGRDNPNEASGFVFKDCKVSGTGSTYLGRAWRGYSRVIFYNSNFSKIVVPQGWDAWHFQGNEHQLTYAEHGCYGPGADTLKRVEWEKKLNADTVRELTSLNFIDTDGWLNDQPF